MYFDIKINKKIKRGDLIQSNKNEGAPSALPLAPTERTQQQQLNVDEW